MSIPQPYCIVLRSCTLGDTTEIITRSDVSQGLLTPISYLGSHVNIVGYPGICFSVELAGQGCTCDKAASVIPVAGNPACECTIPFIAYILTPCDPSLPVLYTQQNLYPYVGLNITFFGQTGNCYTVTGSALIPDQLNIIIVECPTTCDCIIEGCGCPDGYVLNANNLCETVLTVSPVLNQITYTASSTAPDGTFGILGATFYQDISSLPKPILPLTGNIPPLFTGGGPFPTYHTATLVYSVSIPLIKTNTNIINSVWTSRLAAVGIWTTATPNPLNEWIGFTFCETLLIPKTYYIGVAADDLYQIYINGVLTIDHSGTGWSFLGWNIFPISLPEGPLFIEIRGQNLGLTASIGFEIYDATLAQLLAIVTANNTPGPTDLNQYILFSTLDKIGQTWQTGEVSGYTCPDGYTLSTCDGLMCSQLSVIPQIPCFTWQITFCDGQDIDPIITSTDLTQYTTGTYTVCHSIPNEPFPITVCGCATVAQIQAQVAVPFLGTFSDAYDCCESCLAVCYILTDCQDAVAPLKLCTDLSAYVGEIIKIEGCGDICWQVSLASDCIDSIKFEGIVTSFVDCVTCLPAPPVPIPLELNLRRVKPGYHSPNSCITLEYMNKVNCTFAQQVYNEMLIKRYGITVCCDQDIDQWSIQKSSLDYMSMGDPSLCKSTLCYCPAPCLIDAIFTLLPTCVAPLIYSTTIDVPCIAPVLIDVNVDVPSSLVCNCYTVFITNSPTTISYLDCCCAFTTEVLTSPKKVCALYPPISYTGPINILEDNVLCGSPECEAPIGCICYTFTNAGPPTGITYNDCLGNSIVEIVSEPAVNICASSVPQYTQGVLTVNNTCAVGCPPLPNACNCYYIKIGDGTTGTSCPFFYLDCNSQLNAVIITDEGVICSVAVPGASQPCSETIFISVVPLDCNLNLCMLPVPDPCHCYTFTGTLVPETINFIDCFNTPVRISNIVGDTQFCSLSIPTVTGGTIFDNGVCSLGPCIEITPQCVCYTVTVANGGSAPFSYLDCLGVPTNVIVIGTSNICATSMPVLTGPSANNVTIDYPNLICSGGVCVPIPQPCVCYEVLMPAPFGGVVNYTNCSGTNISASLGLGWSYHCSQSGPPTAVSGGAPLIIQIKAVDCLSGECISSSPCAISKVGLTCWQIINTNGPALVLFSDCFSGYRLNNMVGTINVCHDFITAPSFTGTGTVTKLGPCSSNCDASPAACQCYRIIMPNATPGNFSYIDCTGTPATTIIIGTGTICAQTLPKVTNAITGTIDITYSVDNCGLGQCI